MAKADSQSSGNIGAGANLGAGLAASNSNSMPSNQGSNNGLSQGYVNSNGNANNMSGMMGIGGTAPGTVNYSPVQQNQGIQNLSSQLGAAAQPQVGNYANMLNPGLANGLSGLSANQNPGANSLGQMNPQLIQALIGQLGQNQMFGNQPSMNMGTNMGQALPRTYNPSQQTPIMSTGQQALPRMTF